MSYFVSILTQWRNEMINCKRHWWSDRKQWVYTNYVENDWTPSWENSGYNVGGKGLRVFRKTESHKMSRRSECRDGNVKKVNILGVDSNNQNKFLDMVYGDRRRFSWRGSCNLYNWVNVNFVGFWLKSRWFNLLHTRRGVSLWEGS